MALRQYADTATKAGGSGKISVVGESSGACRCHRSGIVPAALAALRILVLAGGTCAVQSCAAGSGVYVIAPDQAARPLPPGSDLLPSGELAYRVAPLDVLQVEVYPRAGRAKRIDFGSQIRIEVAFAAQSYAISPGDVLSIETNAESGNVSQVVVRPDGRITLAHLSQDIAAAGRTPPALAGAIADAYAAIMKSPQVTVTVVHANADALDKVSGTYQVGIDGDIVVPVLGAFRAAGRSTAALAAQIAAAAHTRFHDRVKVSASLAQLTGRDVDMRIDPSGRSFFRGTAKVSPDGDIYVQPAGLIKVAGLSLPEVRRVALSMIQPLYANPVEVSVSLADSSSTNVFVGGEVRQPGRYAFAKSMTLLKLIAMSGWTTEVGDLSRVLLLHPSAPGHYTVYRSNLAEVLAHGAVAQDLVVAPQDIVVVPMTTIGSIDKFVDQYIRRMIPINAGVSFDYISPASLATGAATTSGTPAGK